MANIGLTEQEFTTFCYGALFLIEQYYKDPANVEAFEKWQAKGLDLQEETDEND